MTTIQGSRVTPLHIVAAVACAVALAIDMIELAIGNVLSTVFSSPSHAVDPHALSWMLAAVYFGAVLGAPEIGRASCRERV